MNCVKYLASGYVRGDAKLLGRLVDYCKAWAGQIIGAMKDMDEKGACDAGAQREAMEKLLRFVRTKLVQCCAACSKPLSGNVSTIDGVSYHADCAPSD